MSIHAIILSLFLSACPADAEATQARNEREQSNVSHTQIVDSSDGVIHSKRLKTGVPLGGIGCGTFQLMTDGAISQATINNNWDRPTGDLKGCFAAIWTNAGGHITVRTLALKSGYNLPVVSSLDYNGLFPQALLSYPDPALPVALSLRAYSPLLPHDLSSSSLPVALFVFTIKNESRAPVEASIAFSWENFLDVGGSTAKGAFADRNGHTIAPVPPISSNPGIFGLRLSSPDESPVVPDRLRYNARGTYALLVQANVPDAQVTTAGWNALDAAPGWWAQFAKDGTVAGTVEVGREGSVHPAGVVALKVPLKDRETIEIPFAVAWHTPRLYVLLDTEYGHYYEKSFENAVQVARCAIENRLGLAVLTEEWQNRLLRSTLPPWLIRRLINDAAPLFCNTLLTRDSGLKGSRPGPALFGMLESLKDGRGGLGAMDRRTVSHALLTAWFPALDAQELRRFAAARASSGAIPRLYGNVDQGIGGAATEVADGPDVSCGFVFQVYRHFLWTGDQKFLDELYPAAKRAIEFVATLDKDGDGIPEGPSAFGDTQEAKRISYTTTVWLAALRIGQRTAVAMADKTFAAQCAAWFDRAQKSAARERVESRVRVSVDGAQLAGQWMADVVEAGDILPPDILNIILDSLIAMKDEDRRSWIPFAAAYQASLYTMRGRADAGIALMQKMDRTIVESAGMPWQYPMRFRAGSSEPDGERYTMAASSTWFYLYALEGFALNIPEGCMSLAPNLPREMKTLSAPIFAPTFWGWMDYRPGERRTTLMFRLDRMTPIEGSTPDKTKPAKQEQPETSAGLLLKQVVLPSPANGAQVSASLGRAPAPGKLSHDALGRPMFIFDTPVLMTTGQRLEFTFR